MGRSSKPDAVKAALGNPGKRKIKRSTPVADGTGKARRFLPPDWLENPIAKRIWSDLADELVRLNFLRATDRTSFARYCEHCAKWISASAVIAKEGDHYDATTVTGETLKRLHPMVKVREIAEKHLVELEDRFGLTPLARQKMLRDQSALPPGSLFDDALKQPDAALAATSHADALSPVGFLNARPN